MDLQKTFKCFQPKYVKKFRCDGSKCNAKCCRGWQVDIDRQTHEKYKSISDIALRSKILDSLYWNEPSHTYRMKLDRVACPMLRDDLLCSIQKQFGEDYLSNTCAEFPRRTFVIDDVVERSLSMTCPVAAELALLDPKPMEFEFRTLKTKRAACFFYRSNNEVPTRRFLIKLQQISLEILQDRRMTLNQRLAALALVLSELDNIIAKGKEQQLDLVSKVYNSPEYFQTLVSSVKSQQFNLIGYVQMMFTLLKRLYGKAIVYYSPNQRVFTDYPLKAFDFTDIETNEQFERLYDDRMETYRERVLQPYGHVIENYVVHSFFAGIYPCHAPMTLLNNYLLFLTLFKVFEFGLISMAAVLRDQFTLNDLMEFIERFANRVDHASLFQQITLDFITDKVADPNKFLSTLIDVAF